VVIITLLFARSYFPPDQANKVGKKYIEWLKNNPPDNTISKNLCIGVLSTEEGNIMIIGVSKIAKGKEKEAIEGYKYKSEVILDFTEAYKIMDMVPPEV
jgi:hypothetical protein